MGQALYRKYRSRSFDEVVGQDHITKTLQKAIKAGRVSHAYLFTGPRGVGKTSVARILAHEVNQLPYKEESVQLDIIEIDAASNRRIDEIRDLRERVRIAPAQAKFKVYIIDEVHMLTREAFNALLKTLEEPPAHCIFILATTEAHKLPETIISRTQRFEFKPISAEKAAGHLQAIAKKEKIDIEPEALRLLADFGRGSFRDSIGYLDQLSSAGTKITAADARSLLGLPPAREIESIITNLLSGNVQGLLSCLDAIKEQGVDPAVAASAIASGLRRLMLEENQGGINTARLLKELIEVPASSRPYDYLEISLLETAQANVKGDAKQPDPPKPGPAGHQTPESETSPSKPSAVKAVPGNHSAEFTLGQWNEVLRAAKARAASLYGALRLAKPRLEDGSLILSFQFPLYRKKMEQAKNQAVLSELVEQISGVKIPIKCEVDKALFQPGIPAEITTGDNAPLHSINSIFGAAEVLES